MRSGSVITSGFLKRSLLFFWAVWFTVVTATNACDALKELGLLGLGWQFASGNFAFLVETTARYDVPAWLNAILFAGVIAWEATAAAMFWLVCRQTSSRHTSCAVPGMHSVPATRSPHVDESLRLGEPRPRDGQPAAKDAPLLYPAFFVALMFWAAFVLADEVLIAYPVESTHLRLFTAQLATLLAIVLLPEPVGVQPSGCQAKA